MCFESQENLNHVLVFILLSLYKPETEGRQVESNPGRGTPWEKEWFKVWKPFSVESSSLGPK